MKYQSISHNVVAFQCPTHLGMYPAVVSSEVLDHACKEANHKASLVEYEICARVEHIMKGNIVEAMDLDWLAEIEDKVIGFVGKTAVGMLEHLHM